MMAIDSRIPGYRVEKLLGVGGAACTYEAIHLATGRKVALKTLTPAACEVPAVVEAFILEASVAAKLSHPNLPTCLDENLDCNPPWIAFELVEGVSLSTIIEENDFLDPCWAINVAMDLAYGLAAAHQKGIYHRDIKPANVLFSSNGQVTLIDFGAAAEDRHNNQLSSPESFSGTLLYAAPEQLKGEEVDGRSDLYALGLTLYEMLTGRRLLQPDAEELSLGLHMIVFAQQASLATNFVPPSTIRPGIPKALDELVKGLLAFRPSSRRYFSALELIEDLQAIIDEESWHSSHRDTQRRQAHAELAEAAYWRACTLLDEQRFGEAVSLFASLVSHPRPVISAYVSSIKRGLEQVFTDQWQCLMTSNVGLGLQMDWLTAFKKVTDIARRLEDEDLETLAERRFLTIAASLADEEDRRAVVERYYAEHPHSPSRKGRDWHVDDELQTWLDVARTRRVAADEHGEAQAYFEAGRLALRCGRLDEAHRHLSKVLRLKPTHAVANRFLLEVLYATALRLDDSRSRAIA